MEVGGGEIVFDNDMGLSVSMEAGLRNVDLGGFRRTEQNIVVSGIQPTLEAIWSEGASEMIASASGYVESSQDFLILNISATWWEFLSSKSEFSEFSGDWV